MLVRINQNMGFDPSAVRSYAYTPSSGPSEPPQLEMTVGGGNLMRLEGKNADAAFALLQSHIEDGLPPEQRGPVTGRESAGDRPDEPGTP